MNCGKKMPSPGPCQPEVQQSPSDRGFTDKASVAESEGNSIWGSHPDRRRFLTRSGAMAAAVAPAMTVLVSDSSDAHHAFGHTSNCSNFPNSPFCQSPA